MPELPEVETRTKTKSSRVDRLLEIIPGLLTWLVLTSPIWLSLNLPGVMAFIIIFLDVYWLYRVVKTVTLSIIGYRRMRKAIQTDWLNKLKIEFPHTLEEIEHILIIPSWKERGYIIKTTLEAIASSEYPMDKIRVILALEERDNPEIKKEKREVAEQYQKVFTKLYVTEHPHGIEGEVIGPGSNRTWALKHILAKIRKELDSEKTILTTLDADFVIHPKFLAGLTHKYLTTEKPEKKSFTGVFIYSNNYWQAPTPTRIISTTLTIQQLAELGEDWKYVNFSSHSINLQTIIDLGFWTIDHVNDDSHLYWKAFYFFKGDYQVIPHWLPIGADVVLDETLRKTIVNQYKQLQRWAYGVEHIPYVIKRSITAVGIPFVRRLERLFYIVRANLSWSTIAFLTGFGALITLAINQTFRDTVLGQNLAAYSSFILTITILGLAPMIYLNRLLVPSMPKNWGLRKRFWGHVQFVLSPIVLMTFGTFPAIDAQTRLMLGKYLTYRVTLKYRKVVEPGDNSRG